MVTQFYTPTNPGPIFAFAGELVGEWALDAVRDALGHAFDRAHQHGTVGLDLMGVAELDGPIAWQFVTEVARHASRAGHCRIVVPRRRAGTVRRWLGLFTTKVTEAPDSVTFDF